MVTDIELPQRILNGGRKLKEQGKGWGLREECLVCLLFETGARVSEIMTLSLGDWNRRGLKDTAWARNKGSRRHRAKFVRFSQQTVKLLTRYFNTERVTIDPHHGTLDEYLRLAEQGKIDLDTIPLFLSRRGTPWTVDSFRAHFWKPACTSAGIDADPHQARHWYVNQALSLIHEQARKGKTTVEQGTEELIAYMKWRSGEKVMTAYNHFFQPTRHATIQDGIFKKLRRVNKPILTRQTQGAQRQVVRQQSSQPALPGQQASVQEESSQSSAALYAFLIGTGGYTDDPITTD